MKHSNEQVFVDAVINWFEKSVLGLNLCPFAAKPYNKGAIQFELSQAADDENCLLDLVINLQKLEHQVETETLVLICPYHLSSFDDYNQFLNLVDDLLDKQGWSGIFQVASFHPDYVFEDCDTDDRANWTNRSPYPLLHLIREDSISRAVVSFTDINEVPARNIKRLRSLNDEQMSEIFGEKYKYRG